MRFKEFRLLEQAAEKLIIPDNKGGQTVINGVKIKPGTSQRLQQFLLKNPDLPEAAKAEVVRRIAVNSNIKQVVKANPSIFGKVISGLGNLGRLIVGRVLGIANILGDSTALNADEDALVELDRRMHEQDPDLFYELNPGFRRPEGQQNIKPGDSEYKPNDTVQFDSPEDANRYIDDLPTGTTARIKDRDGQYKDYTITQPEDISGGAGQKNWTRTYGGAPAPAEPETTPEKPPITPQDPQPGKPPVEPNEPANDPEPVEPDEKPEKPPITPQDPQPGKPPVEPNEPANDPEPPKEKPKPEKPAEKPKPDGRPTWWPDWLPWKDSPKPEKPSKPSKTDPDAPASPDWSKPGPNTRPSKKPKTDPAPKTDPKTDPAPKTDPKTDPAPKTDPKTDPKVEPKIEPKLNPETKPQTPPVQQRPQQPPVRPVTPPPVVVPPMQTEPYKAGDDIIYTGRKPPKDIYKFKAATTDWNALYKKLTKDQ
jgi:hypothetical protein